jgi:hypothetical protein
MITGEEVFMRKYLFLILALTALMIISLASADETGITGVWEGETYVPEYGQDKLTLKIDQENGEYSADITDSAGYAAATPCENFEYDEGKITFSFHIGGGQYVYFNLTVEEDTMTGYWEAQGASGDVTLKKQL